MPKDPGSSKIPNFGGQQSEHAFVTNAFASDFEKAQQSDTHAGLRFTSWEAAAPPMCQKSSFKTGPRDPQKVKWQLDDVDDDDVDPGLGSPGSIVSTSTMSERAIHRVKTTLSTIEEGARAADLENLADPNGTNRRVSRAWDVNWQTNSLIMEEEEDEGPPADMILDAVTYMDTVQSRICSGNARIQDEDSKFGFMFDEADISALREEAAQHKKMLKWFRFDMFFGGVLIAAVFLEVLGSSRIVDTTSSAVTFANMAFLVAFMIEFGIRWYYKPTGLCGMLRNGWTLFDLVIIIFSTGDIIIESLVKRKEGRGESLATARLLRLIRIVRIVRLFRLFQELWLMVRCLGQAFAFLISGSFLTMIVAYIFGLLFYELVGQDDELKNIPEIYHHWGGVFRSMLSLLQLSTFDGGGDVIRTVVGGREQRHPLMMAAFVPCIGLLSLGIINLMVGVLLITSLEASQNEKKFQDSTDKLHKHRALLRLKSLMHARCKRAVGSEEDKPMVSRDQVFEWLAEGQKEHQEGSGIWKHLPFNHASSSHQTGAKSMGGSTADEFLNSLTTAHHMSWAATNGDLHDLIVATGLSEDNLHALFDEIKAFHGKETLMKVDDFIQGCMFFLADATVYDVVTLSSAIRSMHSRLEFLDENVVAINSVLSDARKQIQPYLEKFYVPRSVQVAEKEAALRAKKPGYVKADDFEHEPGRPKNQEDEIDVCFHMIKNPLGSLGSREKLLVQQDAVDRLKASKWVRFDGVFTIVVLLNSAFVAIDVTKQMQTDRQDLSGGKPADALWNGAEFVFLAIYSGEFILRMLMTYQLEHTSLLGTVGLILPVVMFDLNPGDLDLAGVRDIFVMVGGMLHDPFVFFDFLLLIIGYLDNFLIRFFFKELKYLLLMKMFRTLRILRMARILYLFHELQALSSSMLKAGPVVLWAGVIVSGLCYVGSVALASLLPKSVHDDPDLSPKWGGIIEAYYSLLTIVSYSDWGNKFQALANFAGVWVYAFAICFIAIAALGVANLITGVVVQSAFQHVQDESNLTLRRTQTELKAVFDTVKDKMYLDLAIDSKHRIEEAYWATRRLVRDFFQAWKLIIQKQIQEKRWRADHPGSAALMQKKEEEAAAVAGDAAGPEDDDDDDDDSDDNSDDKEEGMMAMMTGMMSMSDEPPVIDTGQKNRFLVQHCTPTTLEEVIEDIQELMSDPVHMDARKLKKHVIGSRELMRILMKPAFLEAIAHAGLRTDQFVMLFQRLDALDLGYVYTEEYCQGILRLRQPVMGIDVSCVKSSMRRLYSELHVLESNSLCIHDHFLNVAFDLRGAVPWGSDRPFDEHAMAENERHEEHQHDVILEELHRDADMENRTLTRKYLSLQKYLENMAAELKAEGDQYAEVSVGLDTILDELEIEESMSVDSDAD